MSSTGQIDIRILDSSEADVLGKVDRDVFDNSIDPRYCAEFFADARHHLAVALLAEHVVGMASAVHYVHPDKPPELWINEVGVSPEHRGQGIGKRLLRALLDCGVELGCSEAWVLTEHNNVAAQRLYKSVGGEEVNKPAYFTFTLKDAE